MDICRKRSFLPLGVTVVTMGVVGVAVMLLGIGCVERDHRVRSGPAGTVSGAVGLFFFFFGFGVNVSGQRRE